MPAAPTAITPPASSSTPTAPSAITAAWAGSSPAAPDVKIRSPRGFRISGVLTGRNQYDAPASVTFPLMLEGDLIDGRPSFEDDRDPILDASYLATWSNGLGGWTLESINPDGIGSWLSQDDVALPWLATTWVANSPSVGTPVLTSGGVTAPGIITPASSANTPTAPGLITPAASGAAPTAPSIITPAASGSAPTAPGLITPAASGAAPTAPGLITPVATATTPTAPGAIAP